MSRVTVDCAAKCDWASIGDGDCDPQCNNEACFSDGGDCEGGDGCPASACPPDWRGDNYCDTACFSLKCSWDGGDCGGNGCAVM